MEPIVNTKPRIQYIDLAKGFCILLVVQNHACQAFGFDDNTFNNMLGAFRMPLYFVLSGLFFKEYNDFRDFTRRKINKLLVPFFSFYILLSILLPALLDIIDGKFSLSLLGGYCIGWLGSRFFNQATWFLIALFFTNIIFYIITIIAKKYKSVSLIIVLSVIIGFVGTILGKYKINIPFFIDTALSATPYFCSGYLFRKYTNILYPNKFDRYNWVLIILMSLTLLIPFYNGRICALISNHFYINPVLVYVCGLSGTLAVLLLCKILNKDKILSPISYIGRYSIMILLTHQVMFKVIKRYWIDVFPNVIVGSIISFFIVIILSSMLIPVFKKYMPKFTAQEDLIK